MSAYSIKRRRHERPCELCAKHGVLSIRFNPRNWHPETRRLCTTHQKQLGYSRIDYGHTTGRMGDR